MWICMNDGFVSAVISEQDPSMFKVRARKREHLEALLKSASLNIPIHESRKADYRFRIFIRKEKFAEMIADRICDIDYSNFKDSVKNKALHDLYEYFWFLHYSYQYDTLKNTVRKVKKPFWNREKKEWHHYA